MRSREKMIPQLMRHLADDSVRRGYHIVESQDLLTGKVRTEEKFYPRDATTQEQALNMLKILTDQDFGFDVEAWREWLSVNMPGDL